MPIKRPQFINGEIYHVIVRGIAGQKTFLEEKDYLRYLTSLYFFNNKEIIFSPFRDFSSIAREVIPSRAPALIKERDILVEILSFCLMPNHIHLLIRQVSDGGISLFLQKMGGYSSYFNKKYQRFGSLFQRPFKAIHMKTEDQLLVVMNYIHLNPVDLIEFNWRKEGVLNPQKVIEFLESFTWSSYPHYLGENNFSWLVDSSFLNKILKTSENFQNFIKTRILNKTELKSFLDQIGTFSLE